MPSKQASILSLLVLLRVWLLSLLLSSLSGLAHGSGNDGTSVRKRGTSMDVVVEWQCELASGCNNDPTQLTDSPHCCSVDYKCVLSRVVFVGVPRVECASEIACRPAQRVVCPSFTCMPGRRRLHLDCSAQLWGALSIRTNTLCTCPSGESCLWRGCLVVIGVGTDCLLCNFIDRVATRANAMEYALHLFDRMKVGTCAVAVSYTHLTLPTIYSV